MNIWVETGPFFRSIACGKQHLAWGCVIKLAENISRLRVDDCVYPEKGSFGPRIQTSLQLFYVYSGHAHVFIDGIERHVGAGEITLLVPDHVELFRFSESEKTHHGFCSAMNAELSEKQRRDYRGLGSCYPLSPKVRELTDWAKTLMFRRDVPARRLYDQIARLIFCEFFHAAGYPRQEAPPPAAVARVETLVNEHFAEPIDLDRMAKEACITPTHLIRLFKQYLHITPVEYLWQVRTGNGMKLLTETGLGIGEIAYLCGFSSPYHFSRRFKARYGQPPAAFRKSAWGKPSTRP